MIETFSGVAAVVAAAFFFAVIALTLFMFMVQPIWCIVDCAVDTKRGTGGKVVWIILLVVLYGLTNWFYGAFAASGRWLRRLTALRGSLQSSCCSASWRCTGTTPNFGAASNASGAIGTG